MPRPGVPREHGRFSAPGRHVPGASGPLPLALYDADCGFCTRWMGVVARRDDDTPDVDRYMHEEADGFPSMVPGRVRVRVA